MRAENNSFCVLTGLPFLRKKEWTNVNFGNEYELTISLLGDNILITEASGYVTLDDIVPASHLLDKIIKEYFIAHTPYVHIDNLSKVRGVSWEARKFLINHFKERTEEFKGLIFYNANPLMNLSVLLAKKLNIVDFDFEMVKDYREAVTLALELLSQEGVFIPLIPDKGPITAAPPVAPESGNDDQHFQPAATQHHVKQLVKFIGEINWTDNEAVYRIKPEDCDPLLPVYDAILIFKSEIDDLLIEKDNAYKALEATERELFKKASILQDTNAALNVLIKNMESKESKLQKKVMANIQQLVLPYLQQIKNVAKDIAIKSLIDIVESNLTTVTAEFTHQLSSSLYSLTSTEIKVANLIKLGNTTKEIANTLGISPKTVESHRERIRKKLGLQNQKINLRTRLLSIK
jgi:DNA-binding CsgD family transcriptional regulator